MKKPATLRKISRQDIAAIRKQIKALPKKDKSAILCAQIAMPMFFSKETVAFASLLREKLNKAHILASFQPLLYFWENEVTTDKDYEVMKAQPYDTPYIRVYNLPSQL